MIRLSPFVIILNFLHGRTALSKKRVLVSVVYLEIELKKNAVITSKSLDVLHPLIPLNEGPSKDRRNSRSFRVTNAQLFFNN